MCVSQLAKEPMMASDLQARLATLRQGIAESDTLPKLLRQNAREFPGDIALREKDLGTWRIWSWSDYLARVRDFALGLHGLGIGRGDVVAVIGDNRPDWVAGAIAGQAAGAMTLGIYRDALEDEVAYL